MTYTEAADYIAAYDWDGVTLTPSGCGAASLILAQRESWTPAHELMLARLRNGESKLPLKIARLVRRTRLGDALDLVRDFSKAHIRNQKRKLRRKAARARRSAMAA